MPWLRSYAGIDASVPHIDSRTLADHVESHGTRYRGRPALEYFGVTITYGELDRWANRFANLLVSLGCQKGDVVGIHLPNTPQYVIALVGAAKVGCIVSGVSPMLTAPELEHQINDAGIRVLVTLDRLYASVVPLAGKVPGLRQVLVTSAVDLLPAYKRVLARLAGKAGGIDLPDMTGVEVLRGWSCVKKTSAARMHTALEPDDTILIQYTGGTTSKPKGAQLTQASIFSNVEQGGRFMQLEEGRETVASAFPMFHLAGLGLLISSLVRAAHYLVIPDPRDVAHFCREMQKFPPTLLANVPTLYLMLLDEPAFSRLDFSTLKMAFSGAAPFDVESIRRLESIVGKGKLCEALGMTETSPAISMNPPGRARVGTVGIPLPGTLVKIVDPADGETVLPIGEAGEILVSGPQVMKGYLNLPDATAQALRQQDGRTWLYTGDIGRLDQDGYLTLCDRSKDMLNVSGYKVFSVEIESKLKELDFIDLCAVVGVPDAKRPGSEIVKVVIQLNAAGRAQPADALREQVRNFCQQNMAAYKVPKIIEFMDVLPVTSVGKLDKKALR